MVLLAPWRCRCRGAVRWWRQQVLGAIDWAPQAETSQFTAPVSRDRLGLLSYKVPHIFFSPLPKSAFLIPVANVLKLGDFGFEREWKTTNQSELLRSWHHHHHHHLIVTEQLGTNGGLASFTEVCVFELTLKFDFEIQNLTWWLHSNTDSIDLYAIICANGRAIWKVPLKMMKLAVKLTTGLCCN